MSVVNGRWMMTSGGESVLRKEIKQIKHSMIGVEEVEEGIAMLAQHCDTGQLSAMDDGIRTLL